MKNFDASITPLAADSTHDCDQALARLLPANIDAHLRARFPEILRERRHMLHLAMTEAVALASQTGFPHLFLPTLALEKAESLAAWNHRQQTLSADGPLMALAA